MDVKELVKMVFAAFLLGQILSALGASYWVVLLCSAGMGLFWQGPKPKNS